MCRSNTELSDVENDAKSPLREKIKQNKPFGLFTQTRLVEEMPLFRLEAKIFSREKRGRSVVAAAAYRTGGKLKDERNEKIYDYSRRSAGVIRTVILAPEGAPDWVRESETLWNTVERGEKRVDAQLAREFILALPRELDTKAQLETAVTWAQAELVSRGMVAEVSLHHSKDGRNPHVHILCTLRKLDGEKFSAKKPREWNDVALLVAQRASWANAINGALEKAGSNARVDHRSLKDRGIDREPEPKIGVATTAMQRKGIIKDSPKLEIVRRLRMLKELRPLFDSITRHGEVTQAGMGKSWWEKSICFASRMRDKAETAIKDTWLQFVDAKIAKEGKDGPDLSR